MGKITQVCLSIVPTCHKGQQVSWTYLGTQTLEMLPGTRPPFPEGYMESRSLQGTLAGHTQETLGGSPALGLSPEARCWVWAHGGQKGLEDRGLDLL